MGCKNSTEEGANCYDFEFGFANSHCYLDFKSCANDTIHAGTRYRSSGAAWVLMAAIIVFFMKAGFMLVELSFAENAREKRHVVLLKHQDAFASAFGFFLLGFDQISKYMSGYIKPSVGQITDPVLWFFKFTFASNAATIVGGCLVTNKYKLRIPAAFISAFVISGIIHPAVATVIWSDTCHKHINLSPYRFCYYYNNVNQENHNCSWNCSNSDNATFLDKLYVLDFAGGGAVHLIGGIAGLMICFFAKFKAWSDKVTDDGKISLTEYLYQKFHNRHQPMRDRRESTGRRSESPDNVNTEGFWEWMYPVSGGTETVTEAALGLIILWFCWFAFNCGSAESVENGYIIREFIHNDTRFPFYGIPAVIAINMIMACSAGGTVAILIAVWAQIKSRTEQVNAREVANGVLAALVSITAGCAFLPYWGAMLTGSIGVVLYHLASYLEYRFKIEDTARVVPVHGVCGLWSLLAIALFMECQGECNLHAAFEGLCYCELRLPLLTYWERLAAQIIGASWMIAIGTSGSFLTYFLLYIAPIAPINWILNCRIFCLNTKQFTDGSRYKKVSFRGGWLLTSLNDRTLEREEDLIVGYGSTSSGVDSSTITPPPPPANKIIKRRRRNEESMPLSRSATATVTSTM